MKSNLWIIACITILLFGCNKEPNRYQGYIDSKLRYIATNYDGLLLDLPVKEGDSVNKGQELFTLEEYPQKWDVDEARNQLLIDQSKLNELVIKSGNISDELTRRYQLKSKQFLSKEDLDVAITKNANAEQELEAARVTLNTDQAKLDEALWSISKKKVASMIDGMIYEVYYYVGELVPAIKPVLSILSPEDIKIVFFVPEKDISQMKIGQNIIVSCDGCQSMKAKISFISPKPEYTPPTIFSEETRGKLVFLIKAMTDLETSKKLHPGQPVSVSFER